jgi:hypothetical protein
MLSDRGSRKRSWRRPNRDRLHPTGQRRGDGTAWLLLDQSGSLLAERILLCEGGGAVLPRRGHGAVTAQVPTVEASAPAVDDPAMKNTPSPKRVGL